MNDVGGALFVLAVLLAGCLVGGFMVVGLLGMLANKELTFGEFLVWVLAFVGLLATTIASINSPLFFLLAFLTVLMGLGAQLSSWIADHVGLQRLRLEDIEKFLRGIEKHPEMPYNYRKLAELYYEGGHWEQAVAWYEKAQKIKPDPHVDFWLNKARERHELGPGTPAQCLCGKLNPSGAHHCKYCGQTLPGGHVLLVALGAGPGRVVLLLVAAGLLSAGIATSLLHAGGASLNGLLLVLGVIAAVLYFYATQALWAEQREQALLRERETSDLRPQTSDPDGKAEAPPDAKPQKSAFQLPELPGGED